ncbi:MAG: choice-of-anchor L domain-containing protein [Bacteroidota bacterium]
MNIKKQLALILGILFINNYTASSQITIDNTPTPLQLIQLIAGPGAQVSNVVYTGNALSRGSFTGTSNVGIAGGLLLTTGKTSIVNVANTADGSGSLLYGPGDADLNTLTTQGTYDACVIEFDFIPTTTSFSFRYVFGSEEYPEYVCSTYNDVFAFFVSGPNPAGGNYVKKNIALIPNTTTPVAINSINPGTPGTVGQPGFFDPSPCTPTGQSLAYSSLYVNNTGGAYVMYDGFTKPLIAQCDVTPCASYHVKLAVADVGDEAYDSGVFIEENSMTGTQSGMLTATPSNVCVNGTSVVSITPGAASYVWNFDGGVATPPGGGGDHNVTWPTAGTKNVTCTATFGACPVVVTTQVVVSSSSATATASPTAICGGSSTLTATGGTQFLWSSNPPSAIASVASPTVSPTITTTYTVTVGDAVGCANTASVIVTVNSSASLTVSASPAAICPGGTSTISCTNVPGATYAWSSGQGNVYSFADSPSTTTSYTVTVTSSGCVSQGSVTLTVNPLPPVFAGNDGYTCPGISTNLTATGASSYAWSSTLPTSLPANPNTAGIAVNPTVQSSYTVVGTLNGCTNSDQVVVMMNPPAVIEAGSDVSICKNSSTQLLASGGSTYVWTSTPSSVIPNVSNPTVSPTVSTTYSVVATDVQGCTGSDRVIVNVINPPAVNAGVDQSICPNETATIAATGAQSYDWGSNGQTATILVSPSSNTTYTVTGTDANQCSNTDQVVVFIKALPVANAGTDKSICLNNTTNLSSTGGNQFLWSSNPPSFTNNTSNPTVSPSITTTYTVTVTSAINCTAQDDVVVTVNSLPIADAGSDQIICRNTNVNLTGNGGVSYKWSPGGVNTQVYNVSPLNTTMYSLTVTDANQCSATDQVNVVVNQLPVIEAGSNTQICNGDQVVLTASGGDNYDWAVAQGASITENPLTTTTYTVVGTDINGCTASDKVVVTVNSIPTSDFSFESPICARSASQVIYTGTATSGAVYDWGNFGGADVSTGAGSGPYNVIWNTEGTYNVCLTVTQNNCISPQTCHEIIVNPLPAIVFSSDKIEGCEPLEVQFVDNSSPMPTSWSWSFGDINSADNSSSLQNPIHNYEKSGQYDVRLTAISDLGCSNSLLFQDMITVHKNPVAEFYQLPEVGSYENNNISFYPSGSSQNVVAWEWDFGDPNALAGENTSFEEKPEHKYIEIGYYDVWLYVSTEYGCRDSISKQIFLREDYTFYIPNAFTPNDDGKNELWGPQGMGVDLEKYSMQIFSRWGQLIFQTNDFGKLWDGRDTNGAICQQGVYSWIINAKEADGVTHKYVGHVTLIK